MRPSNSVLPSALMLIGLFTGLAGCEADTGSATAAHEGGPALAGKAVVALEDAPAVRVKRAGEPGTGRSGTVYVAAEGTPYPVRLTADGDDLTFEVTDPDHATDLTALK